MTPRTTERCRRSARGRCGRPLRRHETVQGKTGGGAGAASVPNVAERRKLMRLRTRVTVPMLCLITVLMTVPLGAAEESQTEDSATELAKKTQNPVADLISVPFQNNFNFSAGPNDATIYVLNVQPVIPIHLTEDWNLITRTIMPIIN